MDQETNEDVQRKASRWGWWFFAAAALFYLLTEHRAHLFGALPWLILLACPLMHLFMHGKHSGHGHRADRAGTTDPGEQP